MGLNSVNFNHLAIPILNYVNVVYSVGVHAHLPRWKSLLIDQEKKTLVQLLGREY